MKSKIFLIVCMFVCVSWTYSTAQDKGHGQVWTEDAYWATVECGGDMVDEISGTVRIHFVYHIKKSGTYLKQIAKAKGVATSTVTLENFEVRETGKWDFFMDAEDPYTVFKFNLRGDMGSHYHGTMKYYWYTGEAVFDKIMCK